MGNRRSNPSSESRASRRRASTFGDAATNLRLLPYMRAAVRDAVCEVLDATWSIDSHGGVRGGECVDEEEATNKKIDSMHTTANASCT